MRKVAWLAISTLLVAILLLVSCQSATTPQQTTRVISGKTSGQTQTAVPTATAPRTTATTPPKTTAAPTKEMIKDALGRTVEKPQYGGTLTTLVAVDIQGFDPLNIDQATTWTTHLTNEKMSGGDWNSGPSGKNEVSWQLPGIWDIKHEYGLLAESWEIQGNDTIIFHIRKGVRFHNKPPVNGREMNADDVVYSFKRVMAAGTFLGNSYSVGKTGDIGPLSIQATDKWTIVIKTPQASLGSLLQNFNVGIRIFAKEAIDQWGDLTNWKSSHGTGPWMLIDYVIGSSVTFLRNPDYWRDHPMYPGMKMPFPDKSRVLIIPDTSTQNAAIITGKVDSTRTMLPTDRDTVMKSRPDLLTLKNLVFSGPMIWFRLDKSLPQKDLKVRRALSMAFDRDGIIKGYYNGEAEKFCHPILPVGELADIFAPLNQMPKTVQENYAYNPDMAKKLLADAGYATGFKGKIVCYQPQVEVLSIIKDQWAKIGVQVDLDVRDSAIWQTITRTAAQDDMLMASITNIYYTTPLPYVSAQIPIYNRSRGTDDYVEKYYTDNILPYQSLKDDVLRANLKKLVPYLLDLVWMVELPSPYEYTVWQPWVKSFNGEYTVGRGNHGDWGMYIWIDRDMKFKISGQQD